jgi:hypothetical protein
MKKWYYLVLSMVALGCGLRNSVLPVTIACNSRNEYAKTVGEASARVLGTWKLAFISAGWRDSPPVPNQVVTFSADGTCTIVTEGQSPLTFPYSIDSSPLIGNSSLVLPRVSVQDSTLPSSYRPRLGTGTLFICAEELILDYGTAIDGPSQTYRRVNP